MASLLLKELHERVVRHHFASNILVHMMLNMADHDIFLNKKVMSSLTQFFTRHPWALFSNQPHCSFGFVCLYAPQYFSFMLPWPTHVDSLQSDFTSR